MRFSYYKRPLFILTVLYALLIIAFRPYFERRGAGDPLSLPLRGVEAEGVVKGYPVKQYRLWRLELETGKIGGRRLESGLMVYTADLGGADLGDTVSFNADLTAPFSSAAPGSLDWPRYLAGRGIAAEARTQALRVKSKAFLPVRKAAAFRRAALEVFDSKLGREAASVAGGLVLGEKRSISPELKTAFQDSGSMHLLVASGSNVGFVVFVAYFLLSRLGLKKNRSWPLALAGAGFYVIAAGFDPPLVRAYFMFASGLAAYLTERRSGIFQGLVIACLLILIIDPLALFSAGFQMSFAAAYGLGAGMMLWAERGLLKSLPPVAGGLFAVSFFAQAGLYPLMAFYFHKISMVALVSNILLVPASGVIMGLGFLLALFSKMSVLCGFFTFLTQRALDLFIGAVRFFSGFGFSSVRVGEPSGWSITAFYILIFIFLHAPILNFRKKPVWAALAAAVFFFGCGRIIASRPAASLFADDNSAVLMLRAEKGGLFFVGAGINGTKLANAVGRAGERSLAAVFLPSLSERESAGLKELARLIRVRRLFIPYGPLTPELEDTFKSLSLKGTEINRLWPGDSVAGKGVSVAAAWPCYARSAGEPESLPGYSGGAADRGLSFVFRFGGGPEEPGLLGSALSCSGGRQVLARGPVFAGGGGLFEASRGALVEIPFARRPAAPGRQKLPFKSEF